MSNLTDKMLQNINYKHIQERRLKNYNYLSQKLDSINLLKNTLKYCNVMQGGKGENVPMYYPLLLKNASKVYEKLLKNQIYCPKPWRGMLDLMNGKQCKVERNFYENLIPLIIDQRYDKEDLDRLIMIIK